MKSRIVVALVALLVPAALSWGCDEAAEAAGDRAYDWTVAEWGVDRGAPARVTILLQHPDSDVLAGRGGGVIDASRFRVQGRVYRSDGTPVDVWGVWDTWDNFRAEGGGYVVSGYVDGQTARLAIRTPLGSWMGDAGVLEPAELLASLEMCRCTSFGRLASCVRCGDQVACCLPNPEDPTDGIGLPIPGQAF